MAGRDISVTHEALGAVRVMRTCGMMGEVVGMAVSLCTQYGAAPRAVYADHLDELRAMMTGPSTAAWLETAGPNLARAAQVRVASNYDPSRYPAANINDGRADTTDNSLRWLSSASTMPDEITFSWSEPQTIGAVRIISGWFNGSQATDPVTDFVIHHRDRRTWREAEGSRVTGNARTDVVQEFTPVAANQVRLSITGAPGSISRIWEVEFYGPQAGPAEAN
jgi:hypothetical protein